MRCLQLVITGGMLTSKAAEELAEALKTNRVLKVFS